MLKELTAEVNKLQAECTALSEESREVKFSLYCTHGCEYYHLSMSSIIVYYTQLTQEKNELREEKASIKCDIENLNAQYQQRVRVMFPWTAIDPSSVVMGPPYTYPMPVPIPPGPIPFHPSSQPFPFFGGQNPGPIPNPCPAFVPYPTPANPAVEQPASQYASTSHISGKQDSKSKDQQRGSSVERCDGSNDVATDLELKIPGSSAQQVWFRVIDK